MKLDDSHKKNIYKVPDGYFDELPGKIQKQIEAEKTKSLLPEWNWSFALKIAAPIMAAVLLVFIFVIKRPNTSQQPLSYEDILDEVSVEGMISYLEMTDVTSDEIMENINLAEIEGTFDEFNEEILFEDEVDEAMLDALFQEYNIDLDDI